MQKSRRRVVCTALTALALTSLALTGSAAAELTGNYTRFAQCPFTNPETLKCTSAVTESGEVILGKKKVPITKPVTLQGGYTAADEENFATFIAAASGDTLSKTPQPVPGGLAGLVNCKEIKNLLLRLSCEITFENGLTGVDATLELAKPVSEIRISETRLAEEEGVALKLPLMVHLENPFLGKSCYIGSSSSPIIWELTTGKTSPPEPNKPIKGGVGPGEFLEEGRIFVLEDTSLADNAWSAPGASGCGEALSFVLDPIINASVGVPAKSGVNTAVLVNTLNLSTAFAVNKNNEENP